MSKNKHIYMIKKCGIIFFNTEENKYLLVQGKKSGKWGFPKGHQESKETEKETAIRELHEETGIIISADELNEKIRFKNNVYFKVFSDCKPNIKIVDTNEILKVAWFTLYEIINIPKEIQNFGLKSWINNFYNIENNKITKFVRYEKNSNVLVNHAINF
jgi:8-oxo-dGTP pyrophosphatase MutT (NUDIX family)